MLLEYKTYEMGKIDEKPQIKLLLDSNKFELLVLNLPRPSDDKDENALQANFLKEVLQGMAAERCLKACIVNFVFIWEIE